MIDRRKFYHGKEDQGKLLGSYGPGGYDVRVTNKGTATGSRGGSAPLRPQQQGSAESLGLGCSKTLYSLLPLSSAPLQSVV